MNIFQFLNRLKTDSFWTCFQTRNDGGEEKSGQAAEGQRNLTNLINFFSCLNILKLLDIINESIFICTKIIAAAMLPTCISILYYFLFFNYFLKPLPFSMI
jgi:hypothetical protein